MIARAPSLFEPAPPPFIGIAADAAPRPGYVLRDYQAEDVAATLAAFAMGCRGVVCRQATGLGKSLMIADLSRLLSTTGRVLVVVDVTTLATDLVRTIETHTDKTPGILTGEVKEGWRKGSIVVATKQTLCAKYDGQPFYSCIDPAQFVAVLVDEGETSIADEYSTMLRHFRDGNSTLRLFTCSATPYRSDGRGMGELYDHLEPLAGPLNRNMPWGRDNGWLVPWRQGFIRVSLDFSTLKVRKGEDGERDYSDAELLKLLNDERPMRELAIGIHAAAKGETSIIVCPNDTNFADAMDWHLNAVSAGCANSVHSKQGKAAHDRMAAFKRGEYPYITSCKKLEKGFDHCAVRHVFMLRKTQSRRLGEQIAGRGARPLTEIRPALNVAQDAETRRGIIAASSKPHFVFWDVVGLKPSVKDFGIADIELSLEGEKVVERIKQKMHRKLDEPHDPQQLAREVKNEMALEAKLKEVNERRRRQAIDVKGHVDLEVRDDLRVNGGSNRAKMNDVPASPAQRDLMMALGVTPEFAATVGRRQASGIISGYMKKGKRADYSLLPRRSSGDSLESVKPSPWQQERLHRLGYTGTAPKSHAAAGGLIRELESQRRAVPA